MATVANAPVPQETAAMAWLAHLPRALTILVTAAAVLAPLSLILYQSFLDAPFFDAKKAFGLDAYRFIFDDPDFWSALRNSLLLAAGMTVGGHTVSHPILARLDEDAQRAEVVACRARLEAELGIPMRWFSYPNGDGGSFDARTRAIVAEAGAELAFAFHAGFVRRSDAWDPYALPRIAVGPRTAGAAFAATVTLPQVFGSRR